MRKRVKQRGHFGRIKGINENKHFFDNILCSKLLLKCTVLFKHKGTNTEECIFRREKWVDAPRGHSGDHKSTSKVTCILRAHRNWLFMLFNVNLF